MSDLLERVIAFPKLSERLQKYPKERGRVSELLNEIAANYRPESLERVRKILDATLLRLYENIDLSTAKGMDLKKLVQENNVIFVPNHQSHADYLVLNYILYTKFGIVTHIAGGINLNIAVIGQMFRNSGCFFIRRSFHSDILYKLTLEGYIANLIDNGIPIEFFFEGGRSRSGKLLPPKFGLFQMILETHRLNPKRPLLFFPVSIVHERIPEEKSLANELSGHKKVRESFTQVLGLYKLFSKNFGTIHIHIGSPLSAPHLKDLKTTTHHLAFQCYRAVGKGMLVTPSGLLALLLLDDPLQNLTWSQILKKAQQILTYCRLFNVPLSPSLLTDEETSLKKAMKIFTEDKKITATHNIKLNKHFYTINRQARPKVLYFKNSVLHHFLIPFFINVALPKILNRSLTSPRDLKIFLLNKRKQLKFEFYLPTIKNLYTQGLAIVSKAIGREISTLEDCFELNREEISQLIQLTGPFADCFRYMYEAFYIGALTLSHLGTDPFSKADYLKLGKEVFDFEVAQGRFIKYPESYSKPHMVNTLNYFKHIKIIEDTGDHYITINKESLDDHLEEEAQTLVDSLVYNLKVQNQLKFYEKF